MTDLKNSIDLLRDQLQRYESRDAVDVKIADEIKKHRDYLESLMDRAIRVLYFIAALIVGVTAFLGVKTWWDIESRIQSDVDRKVEAYITPAIVSGKLEAQVNRYSRSVVLAYLIAHSSDQSHERQRLKASDAEIVKAVLVDPDSPDYAQAVQVVSRYESGDAENDLGASALRALQKLRRGPETHSEAIYELVLEALSALRYQQALADIQAIIREDLTPVATKSAAIASLPYVITEAQGRSSMSRELLKLAGPIRQTDEYPLYIRTAYELDPGVGESDIVALEHDSSAGATESLVRIIESWCRDPGRDDPKLAVIVGAILARNDVSLIANFGTRSTSVDTTGHVLQRAPLQIKCDNRSADIGVAPFSNFFTRAAAIGFARSSPSERAGYLRRIVEPLTRGSIRVLFTGTGEFGQQHYGGFIFRTPNELAAVRNRTIWAVDARGTSIECVTNDKPIVVAISQIVPDSMEWLSSTEADAEFGDGT